MEMVDSNPIRSQFLLFLWSRSMIDFHRGQRRNRGLDFSSIEYVI